jgi:mono/diheme cytochrome c family protein
MIEMWNFDGGRLKKASFLVFLLILFLSLSACGSNTVSATSFPPVPADYAGKTNPFGAESVDVGAVNFNTYCEACHGAAGLGDGPAGQAINPKPASLPAVASQVGDDYLFWRVSEGKPGTAMVGWGSVLNEEQIWQVIAYIRTLK